MSESSLIVPVMGPTCAGKSTLLTYAREHHPDTFGLVEVGRLLRAKYPPDYFKGQAAPAHTQTEAWNLCMEGVQTHLDAKVPIILIDGQPRDLTQLKRMIDNPWGQGVLWFIHLYAPREVRRERAWTSRRDSLENLELALARVDRDAAVYYEIMIMLNHYDVICSTFDTTHPDYSEQSVLSGLMKLAGRA